MDEIKALSPQQYGSKSSTPSSIPSAEERKGFGAHISMSYDHSTVSNSSAGDASQPGPLSQPIQIPAATVTSPPTPAASAENPPGNTQVLQQPSVLPHSLSEMREQSSEGLDETFATSETAAVAGSAATVAESQPIPPGGALGASGAFTPEAGMTVRGREAWIGGASGGLGGELGLGVGIEGVGKVVDASARGPGVGGRGYVGERFIRAAEVRIDKSVEKSRLS